MDPDDSIENSKDSKFCQICGNGAIIRYKGVITCNNCTMFYYRHKKRSDKLKCRYSKNCEIYHISKNNCQYCRFQKCLENGFSKGDKKVDSDVSVEHLDVCEICGDDPTDELNGVITCEDCLDFYREGQFQQSLFQCSNNSNNCEISILTRSNCKKCRFHKWSKALAAAYDEYVNRKTAEAVYNAQFVKGICEICGDDEEIRMSHGVKTCESCQRFYRNHKDREDKPQCKGLGNCEIDFLTKSDCAACRLKKCLSKGMRMNETSTVAKLLSVPCAQNNWMGSKYAMDLGSSGNEETENNCVICERGPIKYRYNRIVAACVNCQWFYRHHRGKNDLAWCAFSKNCKIHYENIQCQFCRFQKCLKVGMARYDPQNQNPNEELKCQFCDFSTFSYAKLDLHVKSTEENREKYTCHICKTSFCSRKLLLLHKAKHGGKLFKCQVCEKSFVRKYKLTSHMMSHIIKQPPFECPSCDSTFSEFKSFENHILDIHKTSGWMQCKVCKVSFQSLRKLQLHFVPKNCKKAEKTVFPESIMKILSDASARLAEIEDANSSNQVSAASKVKNTRKRRREKLKKLMLELENEKAEKSKKDSGNLNQIEKTSNTVCPNLDEILQLLSQSFEQFQNTNSEDRDSKELSFFDFLVQEENLRRAESENSNPNSVNPESRNLKQIENTTPRFQNPKSQNTSKSTIFSFREVLKNSEQRKNTTAPIQNPALNTSKLANFNLSAILTPQNSQSSDQSQNTKPVLKTSNVVYPDLEEILQLLSQSFEQFQNTSSEDRDPKELSFFDFLVQEESLRQMEFENSEENSVQSANSSLSEILEIPSPCKSTTAPIQKPALETSKLANFNMSRFLTPQKSQSLDQSENTKTSPQVSASKTPEVLDPKEVEFFDFLVEQENSASSQNFNKDTTPRIQKPAPTMNPQNSNGPILEFSKNLKSKGVNELVATVTQPSKPSEMDSNNSKKRNELNNEKRRKLE